MKETPYNQLPEFEDTDPADLRDGFNNAMKILDKKLHQIEIQIQQLKNTK